MNQMVSNSAGRAPYLRITQVTKTFGDFKALDTISLDIYEGEFVCFLGPSGCGKTTLLRAIAGLDIQSSGRIEQGGRDISALPPAERDFGIVFQSYALFPNLTVHKNIAYGLENRGMKKAAIDARVSELLNTVGLPEQRDKYPSQLSGGQQQRVALARALATSPGLLLLDEPLSALDAKVRIRLRQEIKTLQRTLGLTTIMVTHDQDEALSMADRIVVMREGRLEQVGQPLTVYREPSSAFVADFIGTMNFAHGIVVGPETLRYGQFNLACNINGFPQDSPVTFAIRPEDIMVTQQATSPENSFQARIAEIEFLGSFVRTKLVIDDTPHQLQADLSNNLVRQMNLNHGARLMAQLPRERIRVFPGNRDHV